MKDFELPALEYCTLERATRFIGAGCEVEDLLHWAEIGAINLSHEFGRDDSMLGYIEFGKVRISRSFLPKLTR